MDYEVEYNAAIERARRICNSDFEPNDKSILCSIIFPELNLESADEKIRKDLIKYLKADMECNPSQRKSFYKKSIAWLEKQGEQQSREKDYEDGIYLCYADGYKTQFDRTTLECTKHGPVTHIGIKVGKHKVGLKLNSLGKQELPYSSDLVAYKDQELHALDDYDGKANTNRLKRLDEFEFDLNDDEWIPALGELAIIFKNKKKINEALAFIGGDGLVDDWYWSSTEYSAFYAWGVYFSIGHVGRLIKNGSIVVRPVCAF